MDVAAATYTPLSPLIPPGSPVRAPSHEARHRRASPTPRPPAPRRPTTTTTPTSSGCCDDAQGEKVPAIAALLETGGATKATQQAQQQQTNHGGTPRSLVFGHPSLGAAPPAHTSTHTTRRSQHRGFLPTPLETAVHLSRLFARAAARCSPLLRPSPTALAPLHLLAHNHKTHTHALSQTSATSHRFLALTSECQRWPSPRRLGLASLKAVRHRHGVGDYRYTSTKACAVPTAQVPLPQQRTENPLPCQPSTQPYRGGSPRLCASPLSPATTAAAAGWSIHLVPRFKDFFGGISSGE